MAKLAHLTNLHFQSSQLQKSIMKESRRVLLIISLCTIFTFQHFVSVCQETFPENGIADPRRGHYAFTNATIVKDAENTLANATLIIKDGKDLGLS